MPKIQKSTVNTRKSFLKPTDLSLLDIHTYTKPFPATPPSSPVRPDFTDNSELKLTSKERKKLKRAKWAETIQSKLRNSTARSINNRSLERDEKKKSVMIDLNSMKDVMGELFDNKENVAPLNFMSDSIKVTGGRSGGEGEELKSQLKGKAPAVKSEKGKRKAT